MIAPAVEYNAIGQRCWPMVSDFPAWVHRRVTTFELAEAEFARVRESVDFTIARVHLQSLTAADTGLVVPFGWLRRGALRGFDLRLGSLAVPMLGAADSAPIMEGVVSAMLAEVGPATRSIFLDFAGSLEDLAVSQDVRTARLLAFCQEHGLEPGGSTPLFGRGAVHEVWARSGWFFEALSSSFLAFAILPAATAGRTILKYSYDLRLGSELSDPRLSRNVVLPLPTATLAGSHHVDVVFPEELRATQSALIDQSTQTRYGHVPVARNVDRIATYSRRDQLGDGSPAITFDLVVEPAAFARPATIVCFALLTLLLAGWFADPADVPPTSTAILFATSGAFLPLAQRAPDSAIVRRHLFIPRFALVACGLAVLAAATAVGLGAGAFVARAVWAFALAVAGLAVLTLLVADAAGARLGDDGAVAEPQARLTAYAAGSLSGLATLAIGFNPWVQLTPSAPLEVLFVIAAVLATLRSARPLRSYLTTP